MPWVWLSCVGLNCAHSKPVAVAPFVIRFGGGMSSDLIRRRAFTADKAVMRDCWWLIDHDGSRIKHPTTDAPSTARAFFSAFPAAPSMGQFYVELCVAFRAHRRQ